MEDKLTGFDKKKAIIFSILCIILSRLLIFGIYYIQYKDVGTFSEMLQFGDASRYVEIMQSGYSGITDSDGLSSYAFFPLYPLLFKIIHIIIPINPYILAFFVSSIITGIALYVSFKYLYITRKSNTYGILFAILMSFGAYTIYNSLFYTESLFFLLLVLGLYFLEDKKYIKAGVCGAFLSATKLVGSLFVFAIIAKYVVEFMKDKKINKNTIRELIINALKDERFLIAVFIVPLGLLIHMFYLYRIVGDPFAFIRSHKAWGRKVDSLGLPHIAYSLFNYKYNTKEFAFAVLNVFCIFLTAMSMEKYKPVECVMCFLFTFTILAQGELYSIGRFIAGLVVYMFTLNDLLVKSIKPVKIIGTLVWIGIGIYGIILVFEKSWSMF
ncbi:MAG: hypothetical protein IJS47_03095 [Clostridia bacterium]|nr:hypothetical protein [Clostridia bacterium]